MTDTAPPAAAAQPGPWRFASVPVGLAPGRHIHYSGLLALGIEKLLGLVGGTADQHQQNGMYGAHQLRVRLPNDPTVYRVIVAPADTPIAIGEVAADQHFAEPIGAAGTGEAA